MTPDPLDEQSARLFEAARREPLPDGAEERVLEAARRMRPVTAPRRSWSQQATSAVLLAAALLAVFVVALLVRHHDAVSSITAEPPSRTSRVEPEPPAPRAAEATSEPMPPSAPTLPPNAVASAPARIAPVTLADELGELKRAETALGSGDTRTAFEALDHYDRVLKGRQMRAEATLLRIETLSRAGQTKAAATLAARFVKENPGSPLVDRAQSFISKSSEPDAGSASH